MELPGNIRARPISSVYGKIDEVLLVYPGNDVNVNPEEIEKLFGGIFKYFANRVTFMVLACLSRDFLSERDLTIASESLTNKFQDAILASNPGQSRHIVHVHAFLRATKRSTAELMQQRWAQDPFLVFQGFGPSDFRMILEPFIREDGNEMVAEQLASATNMLIRPTRYVFEGGNVLIGNDYALIGKDVLEQNRRLYWPSLPDDEGNNRIDAVLKRLLSVRYIEWVGLENPEQYTHPGLAKWQGERFHCQPLYHLDLFVSLLGVDSTTGKEIVLVAELDERATEGLTEANLSHFDRLAKDLDYVADQLRDSGDRRPGPLFRVQRIYMGLRFKENGSVSIYSHNNCHVEHFAGFKQVYIPNYSRQGDLSEFLASKNSQVFDPLTHNMVWVENDFDGSVSLKGSLRCMVKVLKRSNYC